MIGFEIEIDLAVTDAVGDYIDGDEDLAASTTVPGFDLVADSRTLNNDADYSNIEFVTHAVSAVGTQHAAGPVAIQHQLAEVLRVRDVLYLAGSVALAGLDPQVTAVGEGLTAVLAPELDYDESGGLLVHYSVGVPLAGMPRFFDRLRVAAPVLAHHPGSHSSLIRDRFNLHQARAFATAEMAAFHLRPAAPAVGSVESRKLDGFLQLAYMQICAVADHLDYDGDGGNIKNLTAVLCRSAFIDVLPLLGAEALAHLAARCGGARPLIQNLADHQEVAEPGHVGLHDFAEDGERRSGHLVPIFLIDFALSVFTGNARVDPERIFGGMREIAPHVEEGAWLVPMELRSIGDESKTWGQVQAELGSICAWAQEAYLLRV